MSATELSSTEIASIKESLLFQKGQILNKTHEFKAEQSSIVSVADEAEAASQDFSNTISIHLHERERNALYAIERALSKISNGSYQCCEECEELIGINRLQASPLTALCIDCQEEKEANRKFH